MTLHSRTGSADATSPSRSRSRASLGAAVVTAVTLLLAACTSTGSSSATPSAAVSIPAASGTGAPSGEPIKIGGTLGLTGIFSGPSAGYKATFEYWANQVNASGGLLGRPVELTIYDDESTPATAATLYQRLINQDKVDLLLAPYTTAVASTVMPIAEQNKMVVWNGGFVNTPIIKKSDWLVTTYTHLPEDYTRGIFDMIKAMPEAQRPTKVAIVTEQNPFSLAIKNGYQGEGGAVKLAEENGLEVVLNEEYASNTTDFSSLIQRAKGANADLLFGLAMSNSAPLVAKAVNDAGFKPKIYCSCASEVTSLENWGDLGAAATGVNSMTTARPTEKTPGIKELFDALQQAQGYKQLPNYAAVGMAALEVMQQSVEGTGGLDQTKLRDFVNGHTFQTVEGSLTFTEDLVPNFSAEYLQWQTDQNQVIWPEERKTADLVSPLP
jgi:branched-chain amino acid transport system substrate-binding protein